MKYLGYWSVQFVQFFFLCFSSTTINRQTSYDSDILHQDYLIRPGLPMNHTRFADSVTLWVVHLSERTETGGPITTSDQTVRVVYAAIAGSCNMF